MAEITASLVKELRDRTNAGMMECKGALKETDGDIEAAIKYLRERGAIKAAKKADREAKEGVVAAEIAEDSKTGLLVEVNCETDFVAKNDNFGAFVAELASDVLGSGAGDLEAANGISKGDGTLDDFVKAKVIELGENLQFRRMQRFEADGAGVVASYIHMGGKVGVLLEAGCEKAETETDAGFLELVKDLTLHIAAAAPVGIGREDVDGSVIEAEREVFRKEMENSGKPGEHHREDRRREDRQVLQHRLSLRAGFHQRPRPERGRPPRGEGQGARRYHHRAPLHAFCARRKLGSFPDDYRNPPKGGSCASGYRLSRVGAALSPSAPPSRYSETWNPTPPARSSSPAPPAASARECVLQFLAGGHSVFATGRDGSKLATLGGITGSQAGDLTSPGVADQAVATANEALGGLDTVVHCAGVGLIRPAKDTTDADFVRVTNTNLRATFLVAKAAAETMAASGGGRFLTVPGILGKAAMRGASAYCASKYGVVGLIKAMSLEYQRAGVQFCLFHFGGVDSPFWDDIEMKVQREKMIPVPTAAAAIVSAATAPAHLVTSEVTLQPETHQL